MLDKLKQPHLDPVELLFLKRISRGDGSIVLVDENGIKLLDERGIVLTDNKEAC